MREGCEIEIPRGNTQRNVNATIIDYFCDKKIDRILDIPCGKGEFIRTFVEIYQPLQAFAADLNPGPKNEKFATKKLDANKPFSFRKSVADGFDLITCISGVMVFDNLTGFLRSCESSLSADGYLVVSNDNCFTLRDRLSFLFTGRVRRFRLFMPDGTECWNYVSQGALSKSLREAGFRIERIRYTSIFPEDWIWIPLVPPMYLIQLFALLFDKTYTLKERLQLFPIQSLLCRHYIVVCRKRKQI